MGNIEGTVWIVFNGEIYNYRELGSRLKSAGYRFRSQSDTEVVLHLYEEKGERCVEELDGMFAFAIWDGRRKRLFLANDRPGKKPLFYYRDARLFAFASEVKALLQHPLVPVELNTQAFPAFFLYGYVPTPETVYQNIYRLPPAHTMTVDITGKTEMRQYWDLRFPVGGQRSAVDGCGDDREVAARVRELVTEAVRKRLVADVPLGAFLSGGIDSSIVVGVMSRLMGQPVKTFSLGFAGDSAFDETAYARVAARHSHTDHTEFIVEPQAIDLIEKLVWHHDGPFGDSSAIPTYIVSRLTREQVTVALNGDGGDELFAGYLRFYGALLAERLPEVLTRSGRWLLSLLPAAKNYHSWQHRAQRFFHNTSLPLHLRFLKWESVFFEDLRALLREELEWPGLENGHVYFAALEPQALQSETFQPEALQLGMASYSTLSQLLYLNFKTYLLDDLLVKMDRSTMANSLEARSPFLDTALAEYAASLPDRMKLRRGKTKYILKKAFADVLPKEILGRGKMGFGVPLGSWFRGEWREYVQDMLCSPQALFQEYVNQSYVKQLIDEHLSGRRDLGHRLWTLLTFEVWLRMLAGKTAFRLGQQSGVEQQFPEHDKTQ
jgi:asparagine synthase (glutamine-hydrolysing)